MPERQPLNASRVARQRLECASLLALLLAARSDPGRLGLRSWTKAATSRAVQRCRSSSRRGLLYPVRCSVVAAARDEEARIESTVRHLLARAKFWGGWQVMRTARGRCDERNRSQGGGATQTLAGSGWVQGAR